MSEFNESLQAIKKALPHGAIKQITQNKTTKKVLLRRLWGRDSVTDMTEGEKKILKEVIKVSKTNNAANSKLEDTVKDLVK